MAMVLRQRRYEIESKLMVKSYNSRPIEYFTIDLDIPEEYVEDFLYYCTEFKPFRALVVQKENTFELSTFFEEKAKSYKELKKIP
jgi:hypothetical protein